MANQPALFRTVTSGTTMTTMTTSSASSSRTVRPSDTQMQYDATHSMYPHSYNQHRYPHHPSAFPPVPARSSSLHLPSTTSPGGRTHGALPSLQIIHPTPSKSKSGRPDSSGRASVHSRSPAQDPESPLARGPNTLNVAVEPISSSRSRRRDVEDEDDEEGDDEDDEEEEEASESERLRRIEEERKARTREKGRERQRRKRERDRKAKDEARASGLHTAPSTSLTTTSHLSIPSINTTPGQNFSLGNMSAPSSASSSYSPTPGMQSFTFSPSYASSSLSGQSSPGLLVSPAVSSNSFARLESGEWTMQASLPLAASAPKPKRHGKGRASTVSSARGSSSKPVPIPTKTTGPSPAKRRKSEPQPEEFRQTKGKEVGLGMSINEEPGEISSEQRPRPRRTASDGLHLSGHEQSQSRSPTPPMPQLPLQYRSPFPLAPSEAGTFFATTLIYGLTSSGLNTTLEQSLNLGMDELEEMKGELAGVFDRWRMQRGFRDVSLESSSVGMSQTASSAAISSGTISSATDSNPASPIRQAGELLHNASFFTPAPVRSIPPGHHPHPSTMPVFGTSQGSVMSAVDSPLAGQGTGHTRGRSLSSTSMLARGLNVHAGGSQPTQMWPDTPTGGSRVQQMADESMVSPSVSIQTPSTGNGLSSFPIGDPSQRMDFIPQGSSSHWRSATFPMGARRAGSDRPPGEVDVRMATGEWQGEEGVSDSPLDVSHQDKRQYQTMGSTSAMSLPPQFIQPAPQGPFATPHHPRRTQPMGYGIPYPPATPVSVKGNPNQMMGYETPGMYTQPVDPNYSGGNVFHAPIQQQQGGSGPPGMLMYGFPPAAYGTPQQ